MSTDQSTPLSRRERPAKPALTRQVIVAAALAIMREEGLGNVTMRRIAGALDTGAASLYVYVRNSEDLHAEILDALLAPVTAMPAEGETWRERLKDLLARYAGVLLKHPDIARMAMSTLSSGANALSLLDALLGLLQEGGLADRDAAWAVDLLLLHATAHAAEHGNWQASTTIADDFATLSRAIISVDAEVHPNIARVGSELMSGGPVRFPWGLDVLINGLVQTPRPLESET